MTARINQPRTGGRLKKSLDRSARLLINAEMAGSILTVFEKLGGVKWLLEWAKTNETEFVRQCLSRLMPAFPKEDPDVQFNQQINIGSLSDFEVATRIAFALSKGMQQTVDVSPQDACRTPRWQSPADLPVSVQSYSEKDLAQMVSQQEIEEQNELTLSNYRGSAKEQGIVRRRRNELL